MTLPASGAISLNQMHVEAGGTSGTTATINDSDIRGLISKASGASMSFSEWHGASRETHTVTQGSYVDPDVIYYGFGWWSSSISPTTFGSYTIDILYRNVGSSSSSTTFWFELDGAGTVPLNAFSTLRIYFSDGTSVDLTPSSASYSAANSAYTIWMWNSGDMTTAQWSMINSDFDGSGTIDVRIT